MLSFVIEVKYPDSGKKTRNSSGNSAETTGESRNADLEKGCKEALRQIEKMGYEEKLRQDGLETILKYGIACNRKKCKVLMKS